MTQCRGRYVDPDTGRFLGDCPYDAIFDDYCAWHTAVAEGRITDRLEGRKTVKLRSRPVGQQAHRLSHPLDRLVEEWS